ncbi:MAG: NnrS family protein, partial [Mesorhizobium sp.]
GHTGRALAARKAGCFVFAAVVVAAAVRIAAALGLPGDWPIHLAACAWAAAFLGFAALYGPMILRPRI